METAEAAATPAAAIAAAKGATTADGSASAAATAHIICSSLVISPGMTWARKKRKVGSPVDSAEFQQVDGAIFSPSPSHAEQRSVSPRVPTPPPSAPNYGSKLWVCLWRPAYCGSPMVPTPPPPPPPPNLDGLPKAPPTVHAVGSTKVSSIRSSGSPTMPTPLPLSQTPNLGGLPMASPTVHTVGSPLAPSMQTSCSPIVPTPPPPPPWSKYLPRHPCTVICGLRLTGCHGLGYRMCHACHVKNTTF